MSELKAFRGTWLRKAAAIAGVTITGLCLVGAAHLRAVRPFLRWFGAGSGCPMSLAGVTPEALERQRFRALRPLARNEPARAHSALDFVLGKSSREEVQGWTSAGRFECAEELARMALHCRRALGAWNGQGEMPIDDAYFRFDPRGILVAVDVLRAGTSADAAARFVERVSEDLSSRLGPPENVSLEPAAALASPYAQSSIRYRFRDYAADVSATNFGPRGVVVREQYRAVPVAEGG